MPTLLSSFQRKYPAVRPQVKVIGNASVHERLLNDTLSISVASKRLDHRNLECVRQFENRVSFFVPPNHSWAEFGRALPSDLIDQPIITREETSGTCEVVLEGLKAFDTTMDMLNVTMELGKAEAVERAVEHGVGVAFVSELVAARGLALGRVKRVETEGLDLHRTVYMARNINRPFTRAQSLFWEFAQSQYEHLISDIWQYLVNFAAPENLC